MQILNRHSDFHILELASQYKLKIIFFCMVSNAICRNVISAKLCTVDPIK